MVVMTGVIYASRIGARTDLAILQTTKPPHLAQTRKSPERPRCAESWTRAAWALRFVGGVFGEMLVGWWRSGCVVVGGCAAVGVCVVVEGCVVVGVPRVWSPFQGCAPWALERVAPIGACVAVGGGVAVGRSHPRSVLILVSPWQGINPSSCQQAEMSAARQRVRGPSAGTWFASIIR